MSVLPTVMQISNGCDEREKAKGIPHHSEGLPSLGEATLETQSRATVLKDEPR